MSKYSIILIFLFLFSLLGRANEYESFEINFSEEDYQITCTKGDLIKITTNQICGYPADAEAPGLPILPCNFAISSDKEYKSHSYTVSKRVIRKDVDIAQSPRIIPSGSGEENKDDVKEILKYKGSLYPLNNCKYITESRGSIFSVLHFSACPFIYDSETGTLFFIDKIILNIELKGSTKKVCSSTYSDRNINHLKATVQNPEYVDRLLSEKKSHEVQENYIDRIDYVIITNEALKESFKPLIYWKKQKGFHSEIITVEEIASFYYGTDLQYQIKNCLYDLCTNRGLQYALLGGDDTVVPVRECYGKVGGYEDKTIPTDLYYACFDGDFTWDYNHNGIYGETDDYINTNPQIIIGRLPARTINDVKSMISKIIEYESGLYWNNKMLMGGVKIYYIHDDLSDSNIVGNLIYNKYIKSRWGGECYNFYDTYTDFTGCEKYEVTASNLSTQMESGYSFIDFNTHGSQNLWQMESGYYFSSNALSLKNSGFSIITTGACHTNAFDNSNSIGRIDPCLSEAFLRNPNSGIIGYIGSSRYGWSCGYYDEGFDLIGPSQKYTANYYLNLFSSSDANRRLGDVFYNAKKYLFSFLNEYRAERWLLFSINLIGDPEMFVWTSNPLTINSSVNLTQSHLKINNNEECTISVTSLEDDNNYFNVWKESKGIEVTGYPSNAKICITKPGYKPYFFSYYLLQNNYNKTSHIYAADLIRVGNNISQNQKSGNFTFSLCDTKLRAKTTELHAGTTIEKGATITIEPSK